MIAGVVLAAGRSRRMGEPKPLLPFRGESFLRRVVRALAEGGCGEVLVVVAPPDDPAAARIAEAARAAGARVVVNPDRDAEQADSLRVGLAALPPEAEAAVVAPADVPGIDATAVRALLAAFRARGAPVVRATHAGRHAHPVLFARRLFAELSAASLPEGARTVIHAHAAEVEEVPVASPEVLLDVDTPADYRRLLEGDAVAPADAARAALDALRGGPPVAGVVVVEAAAGGPALGARMLVWEDRRSGSLGDPVLDARAAELAAALLRGEGRDGPRAVETERGRCTLYLEAHRPPPTLVIVGAGHIARPLCRIGAMLGFRVRVLDDRPEFATRERFPEAEEVRRADFADPFRGVPVGADTYLVLVTRGHKYDFEALRDLLVRPALPAYVGMVGSRRRVRAALEQLTREGIPRERLLRVHAPIGLDIGAETPEEIAVSIAAEVVRVRRGGSGEPLRDRERVAERWIADTSGDAGP